VAILGLMQDSPKGSQTIGAPRTKQHDGILNLW
jgi:hypothetical protein